MDALDPVEVRVLGSLIEKQLTTPEYYPLTLNALVNACNQSTNREPVTEYDEGTVSRALEALREKSLVWFVRGGRAPKFEHRLREAFPLEPPALAAMCVLLLRGPQTPGAIRSRSGRLHAFEGLEEVERVLEELARREPPLVERLPRAPGTKESRYAHRLGGAPGEAPAEAAPAAREAAGGPEILGPGEARAHLGDEVAGLRAELTEMRREIEELRREILELRGAPQP